MVVFSILAFAIHRHKLPVELNLSIGIRSSSQNEIGEHIIEATNEYIDVNSIVNQMFCKKRSIPIHAKTFRQLVRWLIV